MLSAKGFPVGSNQISKCTKIFLILPKEARTKLSSAQIQTRQTNVCSISRQLISDKFNSPLGDYKSDELKKKKNKTPSKLVKCSYNAVWIPYERPYDPTMQNGDPWNRLLIQYSKLAMPFSLPGERRILISSFFRLSIYFCLHQSETMMNSRNACVTRFRTFDRVNWKYTIRPFHKFHTDIVTQSWWY